MQVGVSDVHAKGPNHFYYASTTDIKGKGEHQRVGIETKSNFRTWVNSARKASKEKGLD